MSWKNSTKPVFWVDACCDIMRLNGFSLMFFKNMNRCRTSSWLLIWGGKLIQGIVFLWMNIIKSYKHHKCTETKILIAAKSNRLD